MSSGKFLLEGKVKLCSPAIIGSGVDELTDLDILLDGEGMPFIPASSFVGVLRHIIGDVCKDFWGYTDGRKNKQSDLICSDLTLMNEEDARECIKIRDGIRIDNKKGIVAYDENKKSGAKFDYQVIEKGTTFSLRIEVKYKNENKEKYKRILATICYLLKNKKVSIGAKTNSGFGRVTLLEEKLFDYDFSNIDNVLMWLKLKDKKPSPLSIDYTDIIEVDRANFTIEAALVLKNSFIVRSYTADPKEPDAVNIQSSGENILPGTSLKGAIRTRSERIVNTLGGIHSNIVNDLFGWVDEHNKSKKKGRVIVEEVVLPSLPSEIQNRIKIDRFTGGTIESALFETKPLFSDRDKGKTVFLKITIEDYKEYEAGLMLLVLKDLWTGDLAVGGEKGLGRGVFEGIEAKISWDDKEVVIKNDDLSGLTQLQHFVDSLITKIEEARKEVVNVWG